MIWTAASETLLNRPKLEVLQKRLFKLLISLLGEHTQTLKVFSKFQLLKLTDQALSNIRVYV